MEVDGRLGVVLLHRFAHVASVAFRADASRIHTVSTSIAASTSPKVAKVGAMRMLRSSGSMPPGNVAPAGVSTTPASAASATTALARPGSVSSETK